MNIKGQLGSPKTALKKTVATLSNVCIRCGKERVVIKRFEEVDTNYAGNGSIIFTEYVCPDEACQKMVEIELDKRREKRRIFSANKINRQATFQAKKANKTPLR